MPTPPKPPSRLVHRTLRGDPPPLAVGGHGVWLRAADGTEVLDASGGAAVSCLGHQHPRVVEAIRTQADTLAFAHTGFFSSEPAEDLAQMLVGHEPGGLAYAYFVSGGSEAVEAAVKMARQYFIETGQPGRTRFIARRQSYHGNTLGALSAGGNAWRRAPYAPLLSPAFSHVTPAFAYHEQRDGRPRPTSPPGWPPSWRRSSSASVRRAWRPSWRSPWSAPRPAASRHRRATSRRCGISATVTAPC